MMSQPHVTYITVVLIAYVKCMYMLHAVGECCVFSCVQYFWL